MDIGKGHSEDIARGYGGGIGNEVCEDKDTKIVNSHLTTCAAQRHCQALALHAKCSLVGSKEWSMLVNGFTPPTFI
jgi:hypothetical protein